MFWAINSETKERINSISVLENPSYELIEEQKWYADPDEISFCPKNINVDEIEVKFRKGSNRVNFFGTEYVIAPHFFIPNKEKLGINIIPESKEHRLAKNWIFNRLKNKDLMFIYSSVKKPKDYSNKLNIIDLNIDYSLIGIEVTVKNNKTQRADIIIPFKKRDSFFGNGVVIEIQFSKQYPSTTAKRTIDWAIKGYSIVWLFKDDFNNINSSLIELNKKEIILNPLSKIIKEWNEESLYDLRNIFQNFSRKIDEKEKILLERIENPNVLGKCPKCGYGTLIKRKGPYGIFYGCSYYPKCRHVVKIND